MEKANRIVPPCRGQLKISVYVNYGLLTIHVVQARLLNTRKQELANAYVKIALIPDDTRTKCKTEVVRHTNNPEFHEKFSFEFLGEDVKKRLLITVFSKEHRSHDSGEFLGCMSFGVQHIMSMRKKVDGWYYLLNDDVGRRKHLQVASRTPPTGESEGGTGHYGGNPPPSPLEQRSKTLGPEEIIFMEPHVYVIRRVGGTFGFSVMCHTYGPVFISRVEAGSPAESSGLLVDDRIVRINGNGVNRTMADNVAKIIKNSDKKIILEVQRPTIRKRDCPSVSSDDTYESITPYRDIHSSIPSYRDTSSGMPPPYHDLPPYDPDDPFAIPEPPPPSEANSDQPPFLSPVQLMRSQRRLIPEEHKENLLDQTEHVGLCGMMKRRKKKRKGMVVL